VAHGDGQCRAAKAPPDPQTNLGESPMLEPLKRFGFNIYSDPGVSDDLCGQIEC
jgi:hypothetical protein